MRLITFEDIEYSILIDNRNDITIFSFYSPEPNEDGLYDMNFKHIYGVDYTEAELVEAIKVFSIK